MKEPKCPLYARIIGYGDSTAALINEIREAGYNGLKTEVIPAGETITPSEDDEMAIIICDDTHDGLNGLLEKFRQTGMLLVIILTTAPDIPADSDLYDTLAIVGRDNILNVAKTLLGPIYSEGLMSYDFNDLDFTLRKSGRFMALNTHGSGENRMKDAIASLSGMANLDDKAEKISLLIHYNEKELTPPLMVDEMSAITDYVMQFPHTVDILWTIFNDPDLGSDTLAISLIAAGKDL